jgi:cellulose synthase/poly-beta-1,6-N-acetylglucosamine synthase-like glycosyltransferase/peptidoglycan/xylan/chitin deacetylase (PgdA/CDA1 family)/spore germination protein YaaH
MTEPAESSPRQAHPKPVFADQSGRRSRQVRGAGAVILLIVLAVAIGFGLSLVYRPSLSLAIGGHHRLAIHTHRRGPAEKALLKEIARSRRAARPAAPTPAEEIAGGYSAPWEDSALDSFQAHAKDLTHVYATWLELGRDGASVRTDDWSASRARATAALVDTARANGVRIVPVLGNASEGRFDPARVEAMLADPRRAAAVADQLVGFVVRNQYAGLQIDFELSSPETDRKLAPWMAGLRRRLAAAGKEFSVAVEADAPDDTVKAFAAAADYLVLMAYDEHSEDGEAGPIASAGFVRARLQRFARLVPPGKLVLGVGVYGYDWQDGAKEADAITNSDAVALAAGYRDNEKPQDVIDFDPKALQPTFDYADDDGHHHEVWFLDATSVANTMAIAKAYPLRGAAIWALGEEDPGSWLAFGRRASDTPDLRNIVYRDQVSFTGDGELLQIIESPKPGTRRYERDPTSGLITDEVYETYPSGWVVRRRGAPEKTLALTFDDGPDPAYTPKILDILKRRGVKATFFMIGSAAADHPDLVKRVYAEGHEIGNHSFTHPNMAHVDAERVRLELTATERALESMIGRSVALFRPPYNADSEPGSYGEIMPIAVASELGFVTAGESIDPLDWDLVRKDADGRTHKLRPDEIIRSVLEQADKGHAVLMHDAGGDRSATVAALDPLITALQQRGYRLVTVGELDGQSRAATMPALSASDRRFALMDRIAFGAEWVVRTVLLWGFTGAIVLGLARILIMIALRGGRDAAEPPPLAEPMRVDVLVAAFNEATVINRTIETALASRGADVHVIVVDDGSTDGTYDVAAAAYGDNPRVRLLRKPNGGKASALNLALLSAEAEVVVGLDADTLLAPDAVAFVAAHFADPRVGAVAGNVKVGNAAGLVTRWQSVEYVTSQNVDRRALARVNAITVVPGAVGGWRRSVLQAVGGYSSDTLAEDMDLTWRVRRAGWVIANEPRALAFTEAPHTLGGLMKQRFRWTFGTLQCLWKHRGALFRNGWFGWFALPSLWLFQIVAQVLAPLIDLQLLMALIARLLTWESTLQHDDVTFAPDQALWVIGAVYAAFMALEVLAGWLAYSADGGDKRELWLLPTQRLVYRQIMYIVVWRALGRALTGMGQAWGKLQRTGRAQMAGGPGRG